MDETDPAAPLVAELQFSLSKTLLVVFQADLHGPLSCARFKIFCCCKLIDDLHTDKLRALSSVLTHEGNSSLSLLNLLQFGIQTDLTLLDASQYQKQFVPIKSCNSGGIKVWAQCDLSRRTVRVYGHGDSKLTRGILALISSGLEDCSIESLLDDNWVNDMMGLSLFSQLPTVRHMGIKELIQVESKSSLLACL